MNDYQSGLLEEHGQLEKRISILRDFICTDKFDELPEIDIKEFKQQLIHMTAYLQILRHRVSRLCGSA